MEKPFYVYILANKKNGFLYVGMTSNLPKRIWENREGVADGHTKTYSIKRLVYYERLDDFENAAAREKKLKKWRRKWKDELIESMNPDWHDLYREICK
jgi:putative endonuclease